MTVIISSANYGAGGGGGGDTAEALAFIARTSGLTSPQQSAYKTCINTLVNTNSTISGTLWSRTDYLWVPGAPDSTTAGLNFKAATHPLVNSSSLATFHASTSGAGAGWQGNGTSANLDPNVSIATDVTQFTQNSSHLMFYNSASRSSIQSGWVSCGFGSSSGTATGSDISILSATTSSNFVQNDFTFTAYTQTAQASGLYIATRTAISGAGCVDLFRNGASLGPGTTNVASTGLYTGGFLLGLCWYVNGSPGNFSGDTCGAMGIGAGLSAADMLAYSNAINALATSLGWATY